jgi:transcriptional regulator with XRE-family HTH domain
MKNRIREMRKSRNMTMKQLGVVVDLAESTISQYETGKREPDNETLLKLGEFFGVPVGYLLGSEEQDIYSAKFRGNLSIVFNELAGSDSRLTNDHELKALIQSTYPLSLSEACIAADKVGKPVSYLLQESANAEANIFEEIKKSPSTDESVPGEDQDLQIMNLLSKMQPEQKILLLALLRTTIVQNQGKPVAEKESVGETVLQLEHQGQP